MAVQHGGRKALQDALAKQFCRLVYVTGGFPNASAMTDVLMALQESGCVEAVEVGVPFTDPVGDGPVIEECALKAIQGKSTSVLQCIDYVKQAREKGFVLPVILMGYYNTFQEGWAKAADGVVSAVIVVDLPFEEPSTHEFIETCHQHDISFIPLVTPFTSAERVKLISSIVDTFMYCTCVTGVTGARAGLAEYLANQYKPVWERIRSNSGGCKCVLGFGVSKYDAVEAVQKLGADGLVVGSAMMKSLSANSNLTGKELRDAIVAFLRQLFLNQ